MSTEPTSVATFAGANDLAALQLRVLDLEQWLQDHTGDSQGSSSQFAPHPSQIIDTAEFGGGVSRLDNTGIQIKADVQAKAILFVHEFQPEISVTTPNAEIIGFNDGSKEQYLQLETDTGASVGAFVLIQNTDFASAGSAKVQLFATSVAPNRSPGLTVISQNTVGADHSAIICANTEFVVASMSSDPSPVYNGGLWYRSDLGKLYARINGVTTQLGGAGGMKVSGSGYQVLPSAAASTNIPPSVTAWGNGTYTQFRSATGVAIYIVGVLFSYNVAAEIELDFATGGAGSETVVGTIPLTVSTVAGEYESVMFPYPIAVAATTRVAARLRASVNGTASVKLIYANQSDLVSI